MKRWLRFTWWLFSLALIFSVESAVAQTASRTLVVTDAAGADGLAAALAQAADGDTIEVVGGVYDGPIVVNRSVTLIGRNWPVIDGNGQDTVLKLAAPGATVTGFLIRNSGDSLDEENAGIAVEAADVVVENNRLEETLFGIYLRQASGSILRDNEIHSKDVPVPRRGDPIRVWYSDDVTIENNVVEKGRDVVLWYSERLVVRGNQISGGRYGLHFMYCDDALIEHNRLLHNSVGAYFMYSRRIVLQNNTVAANRGPSGYGVGFKDMDDAIVRRNLLLDNRVGAFLDNSPREVDSTGRFEGNVFAYNDIGVSMLPSVRHNAFSGNSFVENQQQVAVAGGGQLQDNAWTVAGRGNYWSDYAGYDADGDGLGDVAYRAERLFENMMDRQPELRLFLYSPAANAVDFAARAFPLVKPQPKLVDDQPLMAPILPHDVPALPAPSGQQLGWLALALVGLAAAIAWLPRLQSGNPAFSLLRLNSRPPKASFLNRDTTGDKPMIEVTNLTKRFGGLTAVDNLTFTARQGEAVALWGANGAGKTTALRCLLNLIPYDGHITVAGLDAGRQSKAVRRLIGFVPQELTFHDDMSVEETLLFYARLKKVEDGFDFEPLLKRLALWPHLAKPVRDLSGGLKQRLALAIALLNDPPLLVLDEPTSNLDVQARGDFLGLLLELKRSGKTLLFSSHRPEEVMTLADRVLVLSDGRRVADCPPAKLGQQLGQQATLHLYVAAEGVEPALNILAQHGLPASRNGRGILVQVAPGKKVEPIRVLHEADIAVEDFTLE